MREEERVENSLSVHGPYFFGPLGLLSLWNQSALRYY